MNSFWRATGNRRREVETLAGPAEGGRDVLDRPHPGERPWRWAWSLARPFERRDGGGAAGRRERRWWAGLLTVLGLAGAMSLWAHRRVEACGPFFPNSMLERGDNAVLQSPAVRFVAELDRMRLEAPPGLPTVIEEGDSRSPHEATVDAEIADLRRALSDRGQGSNEVAEVVLGFSRSRADLEDFRRALEAWDGADEHGPCPEPVVSELPAGVPGEFGAYFRAARAWHEGRREAARAAWSGILAGPARERRFKTVWAAFMLGRSWHDEDPARAEGWYETTRRQARAGFPDGARLAVASLGWQAQLRLRTNDLAGALRLYADQYAAGQRSAHLSLQVAARRVLDASPEERLALAGVPLVRGLVTAWVLSQSWASPDWPETIYGESEDGGRRDSVADRWLATIEATGAGDVPLAEQMAVLAYQAADWDAAGRWAALAGDSPAALWIQAKLRVREGKLGEAAELLSEVVERFPVEEGPEAGRRAGVDAKPVFLDSLWDGEDGHSGRHQALGELGSVRVARGEFVQALDALHRGGFWIDAAYVAERVLRLEELRAYVDATWPALSGRAAEAEAKLDEGSDSPRIQRRRIRYLLARRMMRDSQGEAAAAYFPAEWREARQRYLSGVRAGADTSLPVRERARAWMDAAWVARTNGLEILGTEVEPDWAIWDGQFEAGPTVSGRRERKGSTRLKAGREELRRAEAHEPKPDERYHYRYVAARLAWEASRLLPNHDPETALILWTGGSWLKARDPKTADLFYKALVRRCRKTELGEAADRLRWFPELDAAGHPVVPETARAPAAEVEVEVEPGVSAGGEEPGDSAGPMGATGEESGPPAEGEPEPADPGSDAWPDPVRTP